MDLEDLCGELAALREEVGGLNGEVATLKGDNAVLKGDNATLKGDNAILKGDNTTLRQEVVHLREEVVRLRQAVLEERTTRQVVVEELRQEVRRRAAPSDRSQGDDEEPRELTSLKDNNCDKCDVTTQTAEDAGLAGDSWRPPAPREANIYHLDTELLKMVLSKMDCRDMFRARRVCRRWRSAIDDIVGDCRRELTDQKTRGGKVPAPATSLELVLKLQDQPKMTELQAPTAETDTDLRLVAATCHGLEKANLRGFKLRISALRRLARANASSLRELTLPAGISDWQLEALLEPLKALERLDVSPPVDSSGKWLRLLPKSLKRLDITGSGLTGAPVFNPRWPTSGLDVRVQLATDTLLDQLAALATRTVTGLFIYDSPSVTPEATVRLLAALTGLKDVTVFGSGVIRDTVLAALHGCSQLDTVQLNDTRRLTDIPALTQSDVAAVSRMAVTCRKLKTLFISSSIKNRQAVLTALHETDLGCDNSQSRTINFKVPKSVYDKLTKPPNGSKITVYSF
ncbi:uncharacterized protein LOC122393467 isoform X2 [Amphibalanus amphitrite]|uniref:uncharacterized protein LOC122393467 isoform X2 n=1 Tax=Amphibalanus amphitrite TaxID=1232801 RepID=UPI001C8FFD04|nr:uncharacterized protein LOC122393467 isoform X2 [Amphibalanus amphitrite]XP_043245426.1 uncharacterized protein LOC122393467 isoform X2 [Amphibalanus amphitrite]